MKAIGFLTLLTLTAMISPATAKSELELLRSRCEEQERQIRQLEEENRHLKEEQTPNIHASFATGGTHLISTATDKPSAVSKFTAFAEEEKSAPPGSIYTVRKGDSWERIARQLHTTIKTLAKCNGLSPDSMLHPGQSLKTPGSCDTATQIVSSTSGAETYTILQGDTYYSIARKYHSTPEALQKINPTVKANSLRPGLVIHLKSSSEKAKACAEGSPKTQTANKTNIKQAAKPLTKLLAIGEPKSQAKTESTPSNKGETKNTGKSDKSKKEATAYQSAEKHASLGSPPPFSKNDPLTSIPGKPGLPPSANTSKSETTVSQQATGTLKNPTIHPVPVTEKITFGEFAAKHGTTSARLNELNGLSLTSDTTLAVGSELYTPAQP